MLHAHSSQVHWLYRKRLAFNAAVYSLYWYASTTNTHFGVLNTHNIENPNYILRVIYLLSCPDHHSITTVNKKTFLPSRHSASIYQHFQLSLDDLLQIRFLEGKTDSSSNSGKETVFFSSCKVTTGNEANDRQTVCSFPIDNCSFPQIPATCRICCSTFTLLPKTWSRKR